MPKEPSRTISKLIFLGITSLALLLTGCARQEIFYWGNYENTLFERYVENDNSQTETRLQVLIQEAQNANRRVPPGVYADYGVILCKQGKESKAISFFEQEKKLYPESSILMNKLINSVNFQKKGSDVSKSSDAVKRGGNNE